MSPIPIRGCPHVGTITYRPTWAECSRCGAAWAREPDGPWRCVEAGREPDTAEGYRCDGCGARYRERPRTCFACGRPSAGVAVPR